MVWRNVGQRRSPSRRPIEAQPLINGAENNAPAIPLLDQPLITFNHSSQQGTYVYDMHGKNARPNKIGL